MARETFDEVLQRRDGYTQAEVDETKQEILERIADGECPPWPPKVLGLQA
mgnify:CR=1 FL=1